MTAQEWLFLIVLLVFASLPGLALQRVATVAARPVWQRALVALGAGIFVLPFAVFATPAFLFTAFGIDLLD